MPCIAFRKIGCSSCPDWAVEKRLRLHSKHSQMIGCRCIHRLRISTILNAYRSLSCKNQANDFVASAYCTVTFTSNIFWSLKSAFLLLLFVCVHMHGFKCDAKRFFSFSSTYWSKINRTTKGKTGLTTNRFGQIITNRISHEVMRFKYTFGQNGFFVCLHGNGCCRWIREL